MVEVLRRSPGVAVVQPLIYEGLRDVVTPHVVRRHITYVPCDCRDSPHGFSYLRVELPEVNKAFVSVPRGSSALEAFDEWGRRKSFWMRRLLLPRVRVAAGPQHGLEDHAYVTRTHLARDISMDPRGAWAKEWIDLYVQFRGGGEVVLCPQSEVLYEKPCPRNLTPRDTAFYAWRRNELKVFQSECFVGERF